MDNTGAYANLSDFLNALVKAGLGTSEIIDINTIAATTFNIVVGSMVPAAKMWVVQGAVAVRIDSWTAPTATVASTTGLVANEARLISLPLTKYEIDGFLAQAMADIDLYTGQWFNAREVEFTVTGTNSNYLSFKVPLISVQEIYLNEREYPLEADDFIAFIGRALPDDDRRNPRLILKRTETDIFRDDVLKFSSERLTRIKATMGFLEPDGSTPSLITRATLKLASMYAIKNPGAAAADVYADSTQGPLKRERTDLHEEEYFASQKATAAASGIRTVGRTGDDEIDRILAAYRAPVSVTGTYPTYIPSSSSSLSYEE